MRHADGHWIWLRARCELVRQPGEPGLHVIGIAVDITERRRAEEALRESEARYRKLFEANRAGVYLSKLDGTILDFNEAYNPPCAFTGFATCPLPPPQNRLPVAVRAGELRYRGVH